VSVCRTLSLKRHASGEVGVSWTRLNLVLRLRQLVVAKLLFKFGFLKMAALGMTRPTLFQ